MILLGYFFFGFLLCLGQDRYATNTWFLVHSRLECKAQLHTIELGHRRQDDFLLKHRQSLLRYTFSYQIPSNKIGLGVGMAYFIHERNGAPDRESELRPFLQITRIFPFKNQQLQLRFRNEFRFLNAATKDQDRLRLQIQFSRLLVHGSKTKLLCFNELFYSCAGSKPWEWRAGVAIQRNLYGGWRGALGYIYQNNENSTIRNIHVIQLSVLHEFLLN